VDHQAASDLLDASLREYGVSIEALERALSTAPAWAEAEARALAAIDDDVARATGAREASRAALDAHGLPPEVDATNAQEALAEASATVQALDTERGALDQQLRDDDALRAAATGIEADLHRAMEHEDRAARLNVLIGSADGKRFRTFAQSLTLEALLLAANEHLSTLAPRYRLRRAEVAREPLELLVVDRDLADELRPVASLSGGETFLVSLALALGLSSLASDRLRIDSLFIDEGFGTLDPETLEIALSTLDALQSEGRQVGIISHVQGIGERIGARVLVERVGGGASRVRVVVG
jgi:exonuclease SbcC